MSSSAFSDIYQPDVKSYEIDAIKTRWVDEKGKEQKADENTFLDLAIYDKGITEKRSATLPTQHQHLVHVYSTDKNLNNDDKVKFNETWFRLEFSQYANDHYFYKGYADV